MFNKLYNEAIIEYEFETTGPLFIKSGVEEGLNPINADNTYIKAYKNGELVPVIPGSSLKGVFRNRTEKLLNGSCNIFTIPCGKKAKSFKTGIDRYKNSCPACKIFGSIALKSRIQFTDAYPSDKFTIGRRTNVAIDRITGAAKGSVLFDLEYIEHGSFKGEIKIINFMNWHINTIIQVFQDINDGYVTIGGLTSKGFGRLNTKNIKLGIRYYGKREVNKGYKDMGIFKQREIEGFSNIKSLFQNMKFTDKDMERCDFNEQAI